MGLKNLSKKKIFFSAAALVLSLFIVFALAVRIGQRHDLVILFTHDLHSNLEEYAMPAQDGGSIITGGYARLFTAIQNERRGKDGDVLLVDGGDFSMGTLFHTIRSTHSPELITMGLLGYDATTFGNHEFEFGPNDLAQALATAKSRSQGRLPAIVASNTIASPQAEELTVFRKAHADYPVMPYMIIKRAGLKIGIFGLMGKDAAIYTPEAKPVAFSDAVSAARKSVEILRGKEKVDMVVCLSHSGTWKDKNISEDEILAKSVPGIDVIVSGHTHSVLDSYMRVGNTYIVSCGAYGRYLGRLILARNPDRTFRALDYRLIPITSALSQDPKISGLVKSFEKDIDNEYLSAFNYRYGEVLAKSDFSIDEPDWAKGYDRAEFITSGIGDLVGDAFRYAVKKVEGNDYRDISLVFEGFGQIRVPLAKGKLTVSDTFRLMALGIGPDGKAGSGLVTFWLSGSEIKKIFELETTFASSKYDMRLQVTGMRFSYDPKAEPFNRVKKVEVQASDGAWQPLEDNRLYRVCTNWKTVIMRQSIEGLSGGKIALVFKDEAGTPITDIMATRVFTDSTKSLELKEWLAVAMYLRSFLDLNGDNLPDLPAEYRAPKINITQETAH